MLLALIYSFLSLSGACTNRASASCSGSCVSGDTFFVWSVPDSGVLSYRVDNSYYAAPLQKLPRTCLDLARPKFDTSFVAAIEASAKSLMSSPVVWELFGIGFGAVLLLSIPGWGFQSLNAMMRATQRDDLP